jgi:beta-galactosidase
MMKSMLSYGFLVFLVISCSRKQETVRQRVIFTEHWRFALGDIQGAQNPDFDDSEWRILTLPHDWSIEGAFREDNPAGTSGGALPGGIGWYRKAFFLDEQDAQKQVCIDFDGVYQNSDVWINNHHLGSRPYGYSSFRYDLTPYLNYGPGKNVLAVRVDNSLQPNARWYTGSGIYRNVWLIKTEKTHVDHWGAYITTPRVGDHSATVKIELTIKNLDPEVQSIEVKNEIYNAEDQRIAESKTAGIPVKPEVFFVDSLEIKEPQLWSVDDPVLYKAVHTVYADGVLIDWYETRFGIRFFEFDAEEGFSLNGKALKIHGVNRHHDLGALGAAVNLRAIERQLEILKKMGCNALRTAHNPPAPELLNLCDEMGFLVMVEAFDMWAKKKTTYDYHLFWEEWHERDLKDMVLRDRNHPSVMVWSIGNEIREQFDSSGIALTQELVQRVKELDSSRPVTCALTEQDPRKNFIWQSGALDLISFNYKHNEYVSFPENYPGEKMVASENVSGLSTRGYYRMPSDSIMKWPEAHNVPVKGATPELTVSAYDHVHAYWGATHEKTWDVVSAHDFISGMFIWSGFDYLGEPVPFDWPARSSYYGIIDLCGFPKDAYFLYQSLWTNTPVLHVFPHWNWNPGQPIDVWAYYNKADEVELFLNGKTLGRKSKKPGEYHVMWRVKYEPGELKALSRENGQVVQKQEIHTASEPARIELTADRDILCADGRDLSFITVKVLDKKGVMVPDADQLIHFEVKGEGTIAGVDNGYQASLEPFKANQRKTFNGMCLLIIRTTQEEGGISVTATSDGLPSQTIQLKSTQP